MCGLQVCGQQCLEPREPSQSSAHLPMVPCSVAGFLAHVRFLGLPDFPKRDCELQESRVILSSLVLTQRELSWALTQAGLLGT